MAITVAHSALPDLQKSVYTALRAAPAFTNVSAGPFDPVRRSQTFPYTTFGEHIESRWYAFQNTGREVLFMLHIWSQHLGTPEFGFKEAYSILDVITTTLETQTLIMDHFTMAQNGFIFESSTKMLDPDGLTRHMIARYRTWLKAK